MKIYANMLFIIQDDNYSVFHGNKYCFQKDMKALSHFCSTTTVGFSQGM